MPHGGWQPPAPTACDLIRTIGPKRAHILSTRGVLVLKLALPAKVEGDTLQWYKHFDGVIPDEAIWFIDGSLFDDIHRKQPQERNPKFETPKWVILKRPIPSVQIKEAPLDIKVTGM